MSLYPNYRLFDVIDYQLEKFPLPAMLNGKVDGKWQHYSTAAVAEIVDKLAAGLLAMGLGGMKDSIEAADKIAIISNNRPEWIITDLAVQKIGAVLVPLYPTTNELEIEFILNDVGAKMLFVSSKELYNKLLAIQPKIPSLQYLYAFDLIENVPNYTSILQNASVDNLEQVHHIAAAIPVSYVSTIIYTSGTTGVPKGVMLTHKNLVSCVFLSKISFPFEDAPGNKVLSFLPLNHIFEKCASYIYLFSGLSIYYAESLETIGENIREVRPVGFSTVPRLLEKIYEKIDLKGKELTGIRRKLFDWSLQLAEKYDSNVPMGLWYNIQLFIANKLVFSKWRAALGNQVEFVVTGGAACQERLLRVFNAAKIPVYEGYGPTENSPVIAVNRRTKGGHRFGTVGPIIEGLEAKLCEDGEIIVKGPTVMKGYYKRPDLTAEVVKDGWLYTGDIGLFVDKIFLKITDRKKELFKTSGGKYVAPQPIENKFKESSFVEQIIVVGADRKFVAALIVPSFQNLKKWMEEQQISYTTPAAAIEIPAVQDHFRTIIDGYNTLFNKVEQIKKFKLLSEEWSIEKGELTPKLSMKRKVIEERHKGEIEALYA